MFLNLLFSVFSVPSVVNVFESAFRRVAVVNCFFKVRQTALDENERRTLPLRGRDGEGILEERSALRHK
jgi:hypothetical protein